MPQLVRLSPGLVKKDWKFARAWLINALDGMGIGDQEKRHDAAADRSGL